ncbi:hypothetical protein [uncultured Deefgea sp.]|uniref:hypothetical protein n=1 Tax=uncultured Deefgea sp. TaxID=1304914 RepID=UPI002599E491|nr:hypothetical protein [uncultured Deefgea sp.]
MALIVAHHGEEALLFLQNEARYGLAAILQCNINHPISVNAKAFAGLALSCNCITLRGGLAENKTTAQLEVNWAFQGLGDAVRS